MKNLRKASLASLALCALFSFFLTKNTYAEDESLSAYISISPAIQRTNLDPNGEFNNSITLTNPSDKTMRVHMTVEPYAVENITYAPIYSVRNAYTQIVNWIELEETDFTIEPYNSKIIPYTVKVPEDVPGGGQYASIFAETEIIDSEQSIHAKGSIGMILIARVSGETRLTGEIVKTSIPRFILAPPVSATATFRNEGNVDADATISIKIENYITGEMIYDGTNDPLEKTILPDTTRDLNISWANVPRLGLLKVTLNTTFMGDAEVKTRVVLVCPIWFMAIILLIILVIVFRILAKRREDRRTRANSRNAQGSSGNLNL